MARARNIKPGLYKNEDLAECSIWARYIFPGLWTLADREGRLEDRPKRIKGELLPFDSQEMEPLLRELDQRGFIHRYEIGGIRYIQILKFKVHQTPHYSEKPSVIKPPPLPEFEAHISPQDSESTHGLKRGSQPPDSLIPDSLIPDSLQKPAPSGFALEASDPAKGVNGHDPTPPVELIPLVGDAEFPIYPPQVQEFERAYPAVDVPQTLREIRAWCLTNPTKRKTKTGALRFVNSWLSREQNGA